jgi:hypothetical protein
VSPTRLLLAVVASSVLLADAVVLVLASQDVAPVIGWGRVALAAVLQFVVLAIVAGWSALRGTVSPPSSDSEASYRRHVPVTFIGVVLFLAALSLDLLYTGIVCPGVGIPVARGHAMC